MSTQNKIYLLNFSTFHKVKKLLYTFNYAQWTYEEIVT